MLAYRRYYSLIVVALIQACSSSSFGGANGVAPSHPAPAVAPTTTAAPGAANSTDASANSGPKGQPAASPNTDANSSGNLNNLLSSIGQIAGSAGTNAGSAGGHPASPSPSPSPSAVPPIPTGKTACSTDYYVPATANPYFAGSPSGSSLTYTIAKGDGPNPTDTTQMDSPVLVAPITANCIAAGAKLSFRVHGSISYASSVKPTDANGNASTVVQHQLGATDGKSNLTAPINSLLGVFLDANDPSNAAAPSPLDYSTLAERDYVSLTPALGQVFFVGTGLTSGGQYHEVTVPAGATRLYFAVMDEYQWNNNVGGLYGTVLLDAN